MPNTNSEKGKLIVLYGVNNLGKTTQVKLLVEKLMALGRRAKFIKIPIYSIEPSGQIIDKYLRANNPYNLSVREVQIFYAFNRSQFETELLQNLNDGWDVILEDYWATGVGWGMAGGADEEFLEYLNCAAHRENLAFLLHGKRFTDSIEAGHKNETDTELTTRAQNAFEHLAEKHGWKIINANQSIEKVSADIWTEVQKIL